MLCRDRFSTAFDNFFFENQKTDPWGLAGHWTGRSTGHCGGTKYHFYSQVRFHLNIIIFGSSRALFVLFFLEKSDFYIFWMV